MPPESLRERAAVTMASRLRRLLQACSHLLAQTQRYRDNAQGVLYRSKRYRSSRQGLATKSLAPSTGTISLRCKEQYNEKVKADAKASRLAKTPYNVAASFSRNRIAYEL